MSFSGNGTKRNDALDAFRYATTQQGVLDPISMQQSTEDILKQFARSTYITSTTTTTTGAVNSPWGFVSGTASGAASMRVDDEAKYSDPLNQHSTTAQVEYIADLLGRLQVLFAELDDSGLHTQEPFVYAERRKLLNRYFSTLTRLLYQVGVNHTRKYLDEIAQELGRLW